MFETLDRYWGLCLLLSGAAGGVSTVLLLRALVSRRAQRMRAEVDRGNLRWGCHIREIRPGGTFGHSGELRVGNDDILRLHVDSSSAKRGAVDETWALDSVSLSVSQPRRDISGARYVVLTVRPLVFGQSPSRQFCCLYEVGDRQVLLKHVER